MRRSFEHHRWPEGAVGFKSLRRATLMHKVPYYTTLLGAAAVTQAIAALKAGSLEVRPLQAYFS